MSTLVTGTIKSNTANPPLFQNTSGTEIGTLCRAWVNFNGTGTVAIRASYNVSSITDNGTGDYTVNFATALADANYSVCQGGASGALRINNSNKTTTSVRLLTTSVNSGAQGTLADQDTVDIAIFR
jgi:hypothetical protein